MDDTRILTLTSSLATLRRVTDAHLITDINRFPGWHPECPANASVSMKLREKIFYLTLYQLDSLCLQITHNPCNVGSISRMPIEALYEDLPVGNRFLFGCFTRG